MGLDQRLTAVVKYKDPITSPDINKARIGFFPKGRYFGFDSIVDSDLPGFVLELKNATYMQYTDEESSVKNVGMAVTPHGMVIHFRDADGGWALPLETSSVIRYWVIILSAKWNRSTPSVIPYIYVKEVGTTMPTDPSQHLLEPLHEIVLGVLKVNADETNGSGVELYPQEAPNFAWRPTPNYDDYFARLNVANVFTKQQMSQLTTVGVEAFTELVGIGTMLNVPNTNGLLIYLPGASKAINYISVPAEGPLSNKTRLLWLKLSESSNPNTLTLMPGGTINVPEPLVLRAGDSVMLSQFHGIWGVIASHNDYARRAGYKDIENVWEKRQIGVMEDVLVSDIFYGDTITLGESNTIIIDLNQTKEVKRIRVGDDDKPVLGMPFTIVIKDTNNTGNYLKILIGNNQYDRFIFNEKVTSGEWLGLRPGIYTFLPIQYYGIAGVVWAVSGNFNDVVYPDSNVVYADNLEYVQGSGNKFWLRLVKQGSMYVVKAKFVIVTPEYTSYIQLTTQLFVPISLFAQKMMVPSTNGNSVASLAITFGDYKVNIYTPASIPAGTYENTQIFILE